MFINLTTNKKISKYYHIAGKFGLMFKKKITKPYIFLFNHPQKQIWHMFFVKFPIDIIFLNEYGDIIESFENLQPWNYYYPQLESNYVIEMPKGYIKRYKLNIGHRCLF